MEKRFREHQEGGKRGAKFLRGRGPLILVLQQKIGSKSLALKVEMRIKRLAKKRKEALLGDRTRIFDIIHCAQEGTQVYCDGALRNRRRSQ